MTKKIKELTSRQYLLRLVFELSKDCNEEGHGFEGAGWKKADCDECLLEHLNLAYERGIASV